MTNIDFTNFYFWLLFCGLFVAFVAIENFARRRRIARAIAKQPRSERVKSKASQQFEANLKAAKAFVTRRDSGAKF